MKGSVYLLFLCTLAIGEGLAPERSCNEVQDHSPQIEHHRNDFKDSVACACIEGKDGNCYLGEAKPGGMAFSRFKMDDCYSCSETNCHLMLKVTPLCKPEIVTRYPKPIPSSEAVVPPNAPIEGPRTSIQP